MFVKLSQSSSLQSEGYTFTAYHFSCDGCNNICTLLSLIIIIKSEVSITFHCLRHNAVCCLSCYVLTDKLNHDHQTHHPQNYSDDVMWRFSQTSRQAMKQQQQISMILGSTSIRHPHDTFVSDRCYINIVPSALLSWGLFPTHVFTAYIGNYLRYLCKYEQLCPTAVTCLLFLSLPQD